MAVVRRTLESISRMKPRVDRAKIDATSEADIRRHMREDGHEDAALAGFAPVIPPKLLRRRLGMTQAQFARALRVPLSTLRNWEQGRREPTGPAKALLRAIKNNPQAVLKELAE